MDAVAQAQWEQIVDLGSQLCDKADEIHVLCDQLERARQAAQSLEEDHARVMRAVDRLSVMPLDGVQWVRLNDVRQVLSGVDFVALGTLGEKP